MIEWTTGTRDLCRQAGDRKMLNDELCIRAWDNRQLHSFVFGRGRETKRIMNSNRSNVRTLATWVSILCLPATWTGLHPHGPRYFASLRYMSVMKVFRFLASCTSLPRHFEGSVELQSMPRFGAPSKHIKTRLSLWIVEILCEFSVNCWDFFSAGRTPGHGSGWRNPYLSDNNCITLSGRAGNLFEETLFGTVLSMWGTDVYVYVNWLGHNERLTPL
jgi:hypothetical protein